MPPNNLAIILEPYDESEFLSAVFGKKFLHVEGKEGRFVQLLPWKVLNDILRQHRLNPPRLRLAFQGNSVSDTAYLHYTQSRRGVQIPRLVVPELYKQLRQGATLIVDAIDEMHEPVTCLAENLEKKFHEHVQVNAYASWRTSPGFDLHWDDHDVIVLQLIGKKQWYIYGASRPYPMYSDVVANTEAPPEPIWQKILTDGDFLYIPRGWWHTAVALNEPTLHLTFGINNRTGIDFLSWIVDKLRANDFCRMDLPRYASKEEQHTHIERLRNNLFTLWNNETIDLYFQEYDSLASPRQELSLPWSILPDVLPNNDNIKLRLTTSRSIEFNVKNNERVLEFKANRKHWKFSSDAELILRKLSDNSPHSVGELYDTVMEKLDRETVRTFLSELLLQGLVAVVEE